MFLPAGACPCSEPTSLPAVPALSPAHTGTWGPSSHPPVAMHPLILLPNMVMSFSLIHPQNCSWDFRNASFHCVCPIVLRGGVAGLRESCCTLVMGEQARWTLWGTPGGSTGVQTERTGARGGLQNRSQREHHCVSHLTHLLHRHPNINLTGNYRFKG